MAILYITEQGATININGGRVVVRKDDRTIQDLPVFKLEQIVLYGNAHLTTGVISHCLKAGIEVAYLSTSGKYRGRLQPELTKNAIVRLKQYQRAGDPDYCIKTAATLVAGKIRNMIAMVKQQRRLRTDGNSPINELERTLKRIPATGSIDNLNGYEGAATAAYFKAFRNALKAEWNFDARQYHPPRDPVNALLSLGYTLLYNDLYAAVNIVGLDPYMGFFHQPRHGHAALASDLMEEHRCVLVDRMVLTVLNRRVLTEKDFQTEQSGRVILHQDALKRFFVTYAQTIQEKTLYPYGGIQTSYRQLIELQVRHFARVLMGDEQTYHPFQADTAINVK